MPKKVATFPSRSPFTFSVKAAANRSDFSSDLKIEGRMKSRIEIRLLDKNKFFVCDTYFIWRNAKISQKVGWNDGPNRSDINSVYFFLDKVGWSFYSGTKISSDLIRLFFFFYWKFCFFHTNPNPSDILSDLWKILSRMKSRIRLWPLLYSTFCFSFCTDKK